MAAKRLKKSAKALSLTFVSEDPAILKQISNVLKEALSKIPQMNGEPVQMTVSDGWTQSGGWVREQDGWPQSGGWYLSKNKTHLEQTNPPLEESVKNVVAAFSKALKEASKNSQP